MQQGGVAILRIEGDRTENPIYAPSGHVIYFRCSGNAGICTAPFSHGRLETTGDAFLLDPDRLSQLRGRWHTDPELAEGVRAVGRQVSPAGGRDGEKTLASGGASKA